MKNVKDMDNDWKIKYPNRNIYIMRNHNWAFSAWEIGRLNKQIDPRARLLHVDFHDDFLDAFEKIAEVETEQEALNIGDKLKIDEFIKASQETGTIKDVYMIGDYNNPSDEVSHSFTLNQFEYEYRMDFFRPENQSIILDLDLDFFNLHAHHFIENNYNENPFLYSDEFIKKHMEKFKQYDDEGCWDLITVSVSPEHCGGNQPAQKLLEIFLECFDLNNEEYIGW